MTSNFHGRVDRAIAVLKIGFYATMMIAAIIILLPLSACATDTRIQRVEVPVILPCVKSVPVKPDFETAHLLKASNEGEKFLALARDYVRGRIYEGGLEAVVAGCQIT